MSDSFFNFGVASGVLTAFLVGLPVAAQTEFQGGGFITDFSTPCQVDGWSGTVQLVARARPAGEPGNHPNEHTVNLFVNNFVMHYRFPEDPFGGLPGQAGDWSTATNYANIGGGFGMNPSTMPRLRELIDPVGTVWTGETAFHSIFEIDHFAGTLNCRARVNIWMFQR